ncbi:putative nitrogen permease regulator [Myxozyma melibiosi]|uniref:Nitrogen permease regulator n=1 Tax=Myxozyma melibiosi TaxID=54550 RepID=A0ABR1EYR6_9ASCO
MADFGGFPPILSLFYTTFHPTEGAKVLFQVPPGSVVKTSDPAALASPLFDFDSINSYLIPRPQLCNKLLTLRVNRFRIVSHPVHISSSVYPRNSFLFNFCFVFDQAADVAAYLPVVRKLAKMFRALELQDRFLSNLTPESDTLRAVVDQVFEDLNNYCECFIPLDDDSNSINIKLFPLHPPPPNIRSFHVPISTVRLRQLMDVNWDPTMEKIVDHIDGINSVRRIAAIADTDYDLTRRCIQHLMYYNCVIVVDIFQFSNRYAVTADISAFVNDPSIAAECQSYVAAPPLRHPSSAASALAGLLLRRPSAAAISPSSSSTSSSSPSSSVGSRSNLPSTTRKRNACDLLELYCSLNNGLSVKDWYLANRDSLRGIDVRRFISFGIIKGLIYRVNSYPILERGGKPAALQDLLSGKSTINKTPGSPTISLDEPLSADDTAPVDPVVERRLRKLSRRIKHFDDICTDLQVSREQVLNTLKRYGEVSLIHA